MSVFLLVEGGVTTFTHSKRFQKKKAVPEKKHILNTSTDKVSHYRQMKCDQADAAAHLFGSVGVRYS